MEKELLIVSLTTWSKRIGNIPSVLDTIYGQSVRPDKVVLNLSFDETIPHEVQDYIDQHGIEIYRTEDTRVYKKFLPTLMRYPNACVVNVDDDMLYPDTMLEDFWKTHLKYPNNPICGNHSFCLGMMCHCGEASLTKRSFFGDYLDSIDSDLMKNCPSSDTVFSFFALKSGHPYIPAQGHYGTEFTPPFNPLESWSTNIIGTEGIRQTFDYLTNRFGQLPDLFSSYFDSDMAFIAKEISEGFAREAKRDERLETEKRVRQSKAYRLGRFLLRPFSFLKSKY